MNFIGTNQVLHHLMLIKLCWYSLQKNMSNKVIIQARKLIASAFSCIDLLVVALNNATLVNLHNCIISLTKNVRIAQGL